MSFNKTTDPDGVFSGAKYIKERALNAEFSLSDPIPMFRREFEISEDIHSAEIFVQSPGFAVYSINGLPITEDKFISATSDYKKILWYDSYDVARLLKKGVNVISVMAGNGFFNEPFKTAWLFNEAYWRDSPQFVLSLKVNGKTALVSDSSWRASSENSYITYSHLRSGEFVDMRIFDASWQQAGFDDSAWKSAIERDESEITGTLRRNTCPPVREAEVYLPKDIRKTREGYLVDFGHTCSGYIGITLQAERGREIEFHYTEDIYPDGRIKMNNLQMKGCYPDKKPFHINKMIASGGLDTFKPQFCYHGFRYVLIKGLDAAPTRDSMKAYFIHNDIAQKSAFKCENEILQYIYDAGIRSTYSNMFWCLTDCPTREKLGWMNDAQASVEQTLINFDIVPLYKKWFEDIKADMHSDGALDGVVPSHPGWGRDWGPVCDCMLFELPYRVYLYTGNASMLTGAISHFEKYLAFLESAILKNESFILADWMGYGNSALIPKEFIRDLYFIKGLTVTALAYRLCGMDASGIDKKLAQYKGEHMQKYIGADGRCTINEQTAVAMMLMFGLYTDKEALSQQLAESVESAENKLTAGMVGVQYLYDALSMAGRSELAYKLITESEPGYKTWFTYGADTLWECWDGTDKNSHNHHMFSNVLGWFYKKLLGIEPAEAAPGFERVELRPNFIKDIGSVWGRTQTVRGIIELGWEYKNDRFEYTVVLPETVKAVYNGHTLVPGKNTFISPER